MANFKIMRNGLNTEIVGDPHIGQSSEDVTVTVTDDGTYSGYTKRLYYSYCYHNEVHRALSDVNSNGEFVIPVQAFFEPGMVKLSVELSNGTNRPACNACFLIVTNGAKDVDASVLPSEKTWQSYIQSYIKSDVYALEKRIDNLILSSGSDSSAEVIDARTGYDGTSYDTLGNAIRTQVDNLNKELGEFQDGFHNLNLWGKAELKYTDRYVNISDGKINYQPNKYGYGSWVLPVDATKQYSFSEEVRLALPLEEDKETATSDSLLEYITTINVSDYPNTKYLAFSILNSSAPCVISEGSAPKEGFELPKWFNGVMQSKKDNISKGIVSNAGVFSESGDHILLSNARSNLRKGIRLVFEATVTSGTDFEMGFSISESNVANYPHNIITVDGANIIYDRETYPHKLSIADRLQMIFEYLPNGTADITLISNGNWFKQNVPFVMSTVAVPYVKSNGLLATDCKLTFICTDIRKKIWCFGDSYFAYSAERWTYYLKEYGYDNNVLLDGFPGMGSINGTESFKKLLSLGTPKIAVWFLGMNDGTDTDDVTPNTDWATDRDIFIELCKANDIEPIFATIPNVPNINHKGKNKWINESGYRYIDMCHAVGADLDVNWYGNMLSNDKIHPSENGARALFAQVLLDLPEVMINNL